MNGGALSLPALMRVATFLLVLLLNLQCLQAFTFHVVVGGLLRQEGCSAAVTSSPRVVLPGFSVVVLHAKKAEIIESQLANDANLCSWTINNPTWDQNIAALLEYNQTYGAVNLPVNSKEYPNLGQWVKNLRSRQGYLTKEQIQQLNDIGFLWKESRKEKLDRQWHEMFLRLKAYKEEYGDCLVPREYDEDPQLGVWVMTQRRNNRDEMIYKERKDLLDSIGFVWRVREFRKIRRPDLAKLWKERYQELIEFKEEHNHTHVPTVYPPNKELGYWVHNQRRFKRDGTLNKGYQAKLDKIGFTWEFDPIWEDSWQEQYEELKTYYQELASWKEMEESNPEGSQDTTMPLLGDRLRGWTAHQRKLQIKGDLLPQRKAMLDEIGFDWHEES